MSHETTGSSTSSGAASRSIPSLDGLRAFSVALVLASHLAIQHGSRGRWADVADLGSFGVRVFFVISGYLITTLLLRERERTGRIELAAFYLRRTLRIFPAFYAYLVVVALLGTAGLVATNGIAFIPAVTYTSNLVSTGHWLTGHSWSLAVEEQFYLGWPLLLARRDREGALKLALLLVLTAPIVRGLLFVAMRSTEPELIWNADFLGAGCALALAQPTLARNALWQRLLRARWVPAVVTVTVVVHALVAGGSRWWVVGEMVLLAPAEAIVIALGVAWAVSNATSRVGRLLNSPVARAIGVLSYSLYLWQQLFLRPDAVALRGPAGVGAALAVAAASYALVERPMLALRGRLEARPAQRAVVT